MFLLHKINPKVFCPNFGVHFRVKTRPRFKKTRSRFSQILEDKCHLTGGEHALGHSVVGLFESLAELGVGSDPHGQAVQCCSRTNVGSVCLCQFAFVIWPDSPFSFFFLHIKMFFVHDIKILIISEISKIIL